ncbi:nudix hydrolase 13, mitochondrial-like [Iris pallida]|uniref:Nudix hydrolase 13, mitochondrial-like n=1 Tax=Iris pallida TaxID=29817 RepID=A0AAX6IB52_IRIPA|nr:nudix hydrolase 13, mitochondrial-like [Iris pallida]
MATVIQARVGREKQRYEDKLRLVAGVIPYRLKAGVEKNQSMSFLDGLEILMISTPKRNDLVFPKGGWENDETVEEAACREALEEAGVMGNIRENLGTWVFRSKSKQNCQEGACKGYMFTLEVTEQLDSYPEQSTHHRRWVNVSEAWELCRYEWMQEALGAFVRLQSAKPLSHFTEMAEPSLPLICQLKPSKAERLDTGAIDVLC